MIKLPFKRTKSVDIQSAVVEHIRSNHPETHPEAFKWDYVEWQQHRSAYEQVVNGNELHVNDIETISKYNAQLIFILTKLPSDIGLQFLYYPVISESKPISLPSIPYERYCVLYNLAVLYNQLADSENRANANGIKQATNYYQIAAGTFGVLRKTALQPLLSSLEEATQSFLPPEFDAEYISGLEDLMVAQAQECAWQLPAVSGTQFKNAALARISKLASSFYTAAQDKLRSFTPRPDFLSIIELQALHFCAVSQYRKSEDDHENHRFGEQITRLEVALRIAKKAVQHAKSYRLAYATGKPFVDTLEETLVRSRKDNDYIYNQNPPSESRLPEIQEFPMVKPMVTDGLDDPRKALKGGRVILGELLGWGASVAIDLYEDRKENWIRDEVIEPLKSIERMMTRTLTELALPASLDALAKPIGLPPSMLRKAEEVRLDDGPDRLRIMSENIQTLSSHDSGLLDEALDFLDQEVSEDESFRGKDPIAASKHARDHPPSHEANQHLTSKAKRYRETLERAMESDEIVQNKIDEHEDDIILLSLPEEELEMIIPNSTGAAANSKSTVAQSRQIRALLEQLSDAQEATSSILSRVDNLSRNDNIRPRIMREAAGLEMWTKVEPSMFERVLEEEMEKYDRFKEEVVDLENRTNELLDKIKEKNEKFLASRKDDPSVKAREKMLQKLDLAYHKYKELLGNLEEGLKFYNDLGGFLNAYKEECKEWVYERRHVARSLVDGMKSLTLSDSDSTAQIRTAPSSHLEQEANSLAPASPDQTPHLPTDNPKGKGKTFGLLPPPSLFSGEWESIRLPAAPHDNPPGESGTRKSARGKTKVAAHNF